MKKFLILMIAFISNLLLLSACSSDNDESGDSKTRYYIKYTVTGGSWYRPPFGHTSNPTPTTIKFQDKNSIVTESQSADISLSVVSKCRCNGGCRRFLLSWMGRNTG